MYTRFFSVGSLLAGTVLAVVAAAVPALLIVLGIVAAACYGIGIVLLFQGRPPSAPPTEMPSVPAVRSVEGRGDNSVVGMFAFDPPVLLVDVTNDVGQCKVQPLVRFRNASTSVALIWSLQRIEAIFDGQTVSAVSTDQYPLPPQGADGFRAPAGMMIGLELPSPIQVRVDVVVVFGAAAGGPKRRIERGITYRATIRGDKQADIDQEHVLYSRELPERDRKSETAAARHRIEVAQAKLDAFDRTWAGKWFKSKNRNRQLLVRELEEARVAEAALPS